MKTDIAFLNKKYTNLSLQIDQFFKAWSAPGTPGCIIAVFEGNNVIHQAAYGSSQLGIDDPLTSHSLLRLGSTSKHFCAIAILMLEDRGMLSLEDSVLKFLPDLPEFYEKITLRHLLNMTSGIRDGITLMPFMGLNLDDYVSQDFFIQLAKKEPEPMAPPGHAFVYSNTNYVLLARIVEILNGQRLGAFLQQNIFTPLKMKASKISYGDGSKVDGRVQGYVLNDENGFQETCCVPELDGDGGIDTNLEDFKIWYKYFREGLDLVRDCKQRLESQAILIDGTVVNYGLGVCVGEYPEGCKVSHAGGMPGYLADIAYYPDHDFGYVQLSNVTDPALFTAAQKIPKILLKELRNKKLTLKNGHKVGKIGTYASSDGYLAAIRSEDTSPSICFMGDVIPLDDKPPLFKSLKGAVTLGVKKQPSQDSKLSLMFDASGERTFKLIKNRDNDILDCPVMDYVGHYYCEWLDAEMQISSEASGLKITLPGKIRDIPWPKLRYLGDDLFSASPRADLSETRLAIKFLRSNIGQVSGLVCHLNRARNLVWYAS